MLLHQEIGADGKGGYCTVAVRPTFVRLVPHRTVAGTRQVQRFGLQPRSVCKSKNNTVRVYTFVSNSAFAGGHFRSQKTKLTLVRFARVYFVHSKKKIIISNCFFFFLLTGIIDISNSIKSKTKKNKLINNKYAETALFLHRYRQTRGRIGY